MATNEITLENFADPSHAWAVKNDPVMGGKSYSTFSIKDGLGIFDGEVVNVPFLQAPGFITMESEGEYSDVSSCDTLRLTVRSSMPYSGYRISFGWKSVPGNHHAFGFKANFSPPITSEMGNVDIPFKDFTVRWNDATGDAIVTCQEDDSVCPDIGTLQNMKTISLWGEGVDGKVHLEIESIKAIGCSNGGVIGHATAADVQRFFSSAPVLFIGLAVATLFGVVVGVLIRSNKKQQQYALTQNPSDHEDSKEAIIEMKYVGHDNDLS
jgi:hypothetical protein